MAENVKFRLKAGMREIEIEGPRNDVDDILQKWWTPSGEGDNSPQGANADEVLPLKPARSARRKPGGARTPKDDSNGDQLDPQAVINQIRNNDGDF